MLSTKKIFRNKMRELSGSSHLTHRSTHKSAPFKKSIRQPKTVLVEVQVHG